MPGNLPGEVTQLIGEWSGGDRAALDKVMPLVYDDLRRLAHRHVARERASHTLQATELVDEVYLKFRDARAGVCQAVVRKGQKFEYCARRSSIRSLIHKITAAM